MVTSVTQKINTNKKTPNYAIVFNAVFTCVNDHMLTLMNHMLSTADKKLFDLAEKAENNEEQMRYMDCTRIFQTEKNDINRLFFINLNNALTSSQSVETADSDGELSLVDQDEMEELVAITTMHAKAMNIYGDEVNHLEARLEYLELHCDNMFDKEAIDPKHICEVFQKTIEDIDMDIKVKLIFYKLFDQEVCAKLGVMYKAINQIFIDNDIMPQILLKTTKQEEVEHLDEDEDMFSDEVATVYTPQTEHTASTSASATNAAASDLSGSGLTGAAPEGGGVSAAQQTISRIVNQFMTGQKSASASADVNIPQSLLRVPTKQDLDGNNCYDRKEVLKALSSLQRKLSELQPETAEAPLSSEQIKQEVLNDISREHGGIVDKQVNLLDERSIDFVGMMFGAIADDTNVSEIMTSLIYQLQIPVMKLAMADESLFEHEEHPARMTLDLLTEAGKGINTKEDHLYDELESIVDNVLDEFDIDTETFEKAVDELQEIIHKEELLTAEIEKKEQKKILQAHAKDIVVNQLKMVTCNRKVPGEVRPLVLKHWSTLMLNRYIRHGRNSEEWVQSVLLLKLMLKCMQPIRFRSQYQLVKNNHLALVEAVNDELYQTRQDKESINDQVAKLKQHFLRLLDEYGYKLADENSEEIEAEEAIEDREENTVVELDAVREQVNSAKEKIAKLGDAARPGVWYEIYNGEERAVRRLKLSVILTDAAKLIFVDRKGVKVIEKDAEDFAAELEDQRSRILADHSTFDSALGKVITALAA
ncbi:MAG TPA: DUF1631 family protein [Gammaproteobacteria bacterium]|nr:DUF1631 family protein [Gammaproteobacteria bacterium]